MAALLHADRTADRSSCSGPIERSMPVGIVMLPGPLTIPNTMVREGAQPACACGPRLLSASEGGPPEFATLIDALEAAAASRGTGITYLSDSVEIFETYTELLGAARHHLGGLRKIGMEQGEPCLMQIGQLRVHIHAMWGCILGGISLVNVSIPSKHEVKSAVVQKLLGVLDNLDAKHVLASSDNAASLRRLLPQTSEGANTTVHDVSQLDVSSPAVCEPMIRAGDVLFYLLTSGSTGRSKCIPERHCAVISHLRHSILHCNYKPSDIAMNWLPFDHVVPMLTYHLCDV